MSSARERNAALRVGISPPSDFFDRSPADRASALTAYVEAGIDHVFIADHVSFRNGLGIDALTYLAAVSGIEPRLDLYAGVLLLALRHPMVAARQINQLALAAPGRVTVGVGVGGEDRHEFEVCGIDPSTRGRRTDVALGLVRRLLDGECVDHRDEFYVLEQALIRPRLASAVPFVVGGRSDAALRRAGNLADGWIATWCSAKRFASGTTLVEETAAASGRTPEWRHGMQLWIGVGADTGAATRLVAGKMEAFYHLPFEAFAKYTPAGPPEVVAEFLAPYVASGASTLNLTPCGASPEAEAEAVAAIKELLICS